MCGKWVIFNNKYKRTKGRLNTTSSEFEKEARLANIQEQFRRHSEIILKIGSISTIGSLSSQDPITNIGLPRNERFMGRDDVLALLYSKLEPSFQEDFSLRARSSCVIHAIRGIEKTKTALEYTYRYRHCYSYIFWLRVQTSTVLLESFLDVVRKLGLDEKEADPGKRLQLGLEWFQSTASPWLLVFDNAEEASGIQKFWPAGNRGAIIVTSQNPLLAYNTKYEIYLPPMQPKEGSALIQSYLNRGGSEQKSAQMLLTSLGGLPLAITHFAGYVARSQCPLDQIYNSLDRRMKSSQVWKAGGVLLNSAYGYTLNTVWNLAFNRLSTDSKKLLEFLAFLDPDQVPVEMFTRTESTVNTTDWRYWDTERFDAAIGILRERHLVERYSLPSGDFLKTHRALQRTILQGLDTDLPRRQNVFDEVVTIARKAFPAANIITRGDTTQYIQSAKYMPQIISIHANFVQSDPEIQKRLEFAKVLSDVGYYGVNNASQAEALDLLQTGESICTALLDSQPVAIRPILGVDGRRRALGMNKRAIANREQQMAGIPRDEWTQLDFVNLARAHNDMGVSLSQLNRVEEASQWFDSALEFYKLAGNEETLTSRFGHVYCFQLWPLGIKQKAVEVRELARRSMTLVAKAVGEDSPLSLQTKFFVAMIFLSVGYVDEALKLHKEVFEKRLVRQGTSNHLTLGSQFNLAVCYHNLDDLETAETHLRGILANSCATMQWRDEDIVRTKFRLSLVLHAQNRPGEASTVREEIAKTLEDARAMSEQRTYTDEDDMKLLDFGVSIFHGRTAGIWSNGTY